MTCPVDPIQESIGWFALKLITESDRQIYGDTGSSSPQPEPKTVIRFAGQHELGCTTNQLTQVSRTWLLIFGLAHLFVVWLYEGKQIITKIVPIALFTQSNQELSRFETFFYCSVNTALKVPVIRKQIEVDFLKLGFVHPVVEPRGGRKPLPAIRQEPRPHRAISRFDPPGRDTALAPARPICRLLARPAKEAHAPRDPQNRPWRAQTNRPRVRIVRAPPYRVHRRHHSLRSFRHAAFDQRQPASVLHTNAAARRR